MVGSGHMGGWGIFLLPFLWDLHYYLLKSNKLLTESILLGRGGGCTNKPIQH